MPLKCCHKSYFSYISITRITSWFAAIWWPLHHCLYRAVSVHNLTNNPPAVNTWKDGEITHLPFYFSVFGASPDTWEEASNSNTWEQWQWSLCVEVPRGHGTVKWWIRKRAELNIAGVKEGPGARKQHYRHSRRLAASKSLNDMSIAY